MFGFELPVQVYSDGQAAIDAIKDGYGRMVYTKRTHGLSLAWLHELFLKPWLHIFKIPTERNLADLMTKALGRIKLQFFMENIGLRTNDAEEQLRASVHPGGRVVDKIKGAIGQQEL